MTSSTATTEGDYSVRAMTDDGAFRVIVARTTCTAQGIARAQAARGDNAKNLADLVTATVLFRETMSPGLRVQGILRSSAGRGTLVADSAPEGKTRGLIQAKEGEVVQATAGALLQMMRTLHNGSISQGVVQVPEGGGITHAMMAYMKESEQVDTMLAVGARVEEDKLVGAGGYMVQLLPEVGRGPLAVMAERLEDFRNIDHLLGADFTPESLRDELLYAMPHTPLDTTPIEFSCWCSESRLLGAISTLDRAEVQSMIDEGTPLEITCDYCGKDYTLQPASLVGLLKSN